MKYREIKNLSNVELQKRLSQTRQGLLSARVKHKMKRLSNAMELRNLKKDIARLSLALSLKPPEPVSVKKDALVKKTTKPVEKIKLDQKKQDQKKQSLVDKKNVAQKVMPKKAIQSDVQLELKSDGETKKEIKKETKKPVEKKPVEKNTTGWLGRLFRRQK